MNILVTGGSGFIGTNVVSYYLDLGAKVINLDILKPRLQSHFSVWRQIDIRDNESVIGIFHDFKPDYVIHMAARTDLNGTSIKDYDSNTDGVEVIANAVISTPSIKYSVFVSSMLVCKIGYQPASEDDYNPSTIYGQSKALGEKILKEKLSHLNAWTMVRPTSIYGPYFSAPYIDFFRSVRDGWFFFPAGISVKRNYGFVLNLVSQIDFILKSKIASLEKRAIYIADYEPLDLLSFAKSISNEFGMAKGVRQLPLWIFYLASRMGDLLKFLGYTNPPLTTFRLNNILTNQIVDISPLRDVFPKLPYDINSAVKITSQWLNENDIK